jgi:hypothetical protein
MVDADTEELKHAGEPWIDDLWLPSGASRSPPVRAALDPGDADESLWAGRQFLADGVARASRAYPPL